MFFCWGCLAQNGLVVIPYDGYEERDMKIVTMRKYVRSWRSIHLFFYYTFFGFIKYHQMFLIKSQMAANLVGNQNYSIQWCKDLSRYVRNTPSSSYEITTKGKDLRRTPGTFRWIFWNIPLYNLKYFTSRSFWWSPNFILSPLEIGLSAQTGTLLGKLQILASFNNLRQLHIFFSILN